MAYKKHESYIQNEPPKATFQYCMVLFTAFSDEAKAFTLSKQALHNASSASFVQSGFAFFVYL